MSNYHRTDVPSYEVLINEAGVETEEPDEAKVKLWSKIWDAAAKQWEYPCEVTICEVKGRLCIGLHLTWSALSPGQWMYIGTKLFSKEWCKYELNLASGSVDDAYVSLFFSALKRKNRKTKSLTYAELRKLFKQVRLDFSDLMGESDNGSGGGYRA